MLQNVFRGLCLTGGVVLVAGAIGVLTGLEHLMSGRSVAQPRAKPYVKKGHRVTLNKADRFAIRRTKSELGYVYWVLQGYGKYSGFTLFDTWQEAIDEVQRRIGAPSAVHESVLPPAFAVYS